MGKPRAMNSPNAEKLVEYGVARFGNLTHIIADEPLALLAASHFFATETSWPLRHFLLEALSTSDDSARGFAFEHLGAYLLGLAFRSPTRLSNVFDFVVPGGLQDEVAELVALQKSTNDTFSCFPVDISSDMGPSYILGRSPRTEMETLAWFKDPQRNIFCFPAKTIGPDLVLVLKLSDGSLLRVLIQFKNHLQNTLGPVNTADGFRTTDPKQFISQRSAKEPPSQQTHSAEGPLQTEMDEKKPYALSLFLVPLLTYHPLITGGHCRAFMLQTLS
jgi:hypothetical protein